MLNRVMYFFRNSFIGSLFNQKYKTFLNISYFYNRNAITLSLPHEHNGVHKLCFWYKSTIWAVIGEPFTYLTKENNCIYFKGEYSKTFICEFQYCIILTGHVI